MTTTKEAPRLAESTFPEDVLPTARFFATIFQHEDGTPKPAWESLTSIDGQACTIRLKQLTHRTEIRIWRRGREELWVMDESHPELVALTLNEFFVPSILTGEEYKVRCYNQLKSRIISVNLFFPVSRESFFDGEWKPLGGWPPSPMPLRMIHNVRREKSGVIYQGGIGSSEDAIKIFTDLRESIRNARPLSPEQFTEKPGVLSRPY